MQKVNKLRQIPPIFNFSIFYKYFEKLEVPNGLLHATPLPTMHIPTVPPRPTTSIYCTQRIAAAVTATKQNKKKKKQSVRILKNFSRNVKSILPPMQRAISVGDKSQTLRILLGSQRLRFLATHRKVVCCWCAKRFLPLFRLFARLHSPLVPPI